MVERGPAKAAELAVSRRDRRWVLLASASLMALTLVPYVVHGFVPEKGYVYQGIEWTPNDQLCYLSWINQVRSDGWLVRNLYVQDMQDRTWPQPIWLLLGLLGRIVPVSSVALYHAARLVFGVMYLCALFRLLGRFTARRVMQWTAWGLAVTGGGLGWLEAWRADAWTWEMARSADAITELWTWPSLLYYPHFPLALLLLVLTVEQLLIAWRTGRLRHAGWAGLWLGLLALTHTYTALTVAAAIALHAVLCVCFRVAWRRVLAAGLVVGLAALPLVGLQAWQFLSSEMMRQWSASAAMPSPPFVSYARGFGVVGVLAVLGLGWTVWRWVAGWYGRTRQAASLQGRQDGQDGEGEEAVAVRVEELLLVAWVAATVGLIFSGLDFERRFVEGLHIPLCLLAATTLAGPAVARGRRTHWGWAAACALALAAAMPTSVLTSVRDLPSRLGYGPVGALDAEQVVYERLGPGATVFCDGWYGQWLPARGRVRVYLGHWQLSFGHDLRYATVTEFLALATTPARRLELFRESGCDAVLLLGWQVRTLADDPGWQMLAPVTDGALFVPAGR